MRKFIVILLVVFVLGLCSNALAMDLVGKFGFSGRGLLGIPMGNFADDNKVGADMGYGFGATGEFFLTDQIALGGYFDYSSYGLGSFGGIDYSLKLTNFGVFIKHIFPTSSNKSLYLKANAGLYKPKVSAKFGSLSGSESFEMKFGFGFGGGIMFEVSEFVLVGGEAMFHSAIVKDAEATFEGETEKFGYDLEYIEINFGITFLIGGR